MSERHRVNRSEVTLAGYGELLIGKANSTCAVSDKRAAVTDLSHTFVCGDDKSGGVIVFLAAVEYPCRLSLIDQILSAFAQFVMIKILIPQEQIFYVSNDVAIANHVERAYADSEASRSRRVPGCSPFNYFRVV